MFRRAKLMLADVPDPRLPEVTVRVDLTDECGMPRCARLRASCDHLGLSACHSSASIAYWKPSIQPWSRWSAVAQGVALPTHAEALHQPPRGLVDREAARDHAAYAELLEGEREQGGDRLGGVPATLVRRRDDPAELDLGSLGLAADLALCPAVLDLEHEVANDLAVVPDQDGLVHDVGGGVPLGVVRPVGRQAGQPLGDGRVAAVGPGGRGVGGRGATQGEALGADGPGDVVERRTHAGIMPRAPNRVRPRSRRASA